MVAEGRQVQVCGGRGQAGPGVAGNNEMNIKVVTGVWCERQGESPINPVVSFKGLRV